MFLQTQKRSPTGITVCSLNAIVGLSVLSTRFSFSASNTPRTPVTAVYNVRIEPNSPTTLFPRG